MCKYFLVSIHPYIVPTIVVLEIRIHPLSHTSLIVSELPRRFELLKRPGECRLRGNFTLPFPFTEPSSRRNSFSSLFHFRNFKITSVLFVLRPSDRRHLVGILLSALPSGRNTKDTFKIFAETANSTPVYCSLSSFPISASPALRLRPPCYVKSQADSLSLCFFIP
jgi:hypothetical protein